METVPANYCKVVDDGETVDFTISWDCPNCGATNETGFCMDSDECDDPSMFFYTNQTCPVCGVESEVYVDSPEVE